jgi:hypothetical protein
MEPPHWAVRSQWHPQPVDAGKLELGIDGSAPAATGTATIMAASTRASMVVRFIGLPLFPSFQHRLGTLFT